MDLLPPCCAGLGVHKDTAYACARHHGPAGAAREAVRVSGTTTPELLALGDWLAGQGVTHVARESTGAYRKPAYSPPEGRFALVLANAPQLQRVPGREADVQDRAWVAQLLQHGLIAPSFVPPAPQLGGADRTGRGPSRPGGGPPDDDPRGGPPDGGGGGGGGRPGHEPVPRGGPPGEPGGDVPRQ